jgi:aspartate-semialdehyde dehydrogenase
VGKKVAFAGKEIAVEELRAEAFAYVDYALFSAGATRSREFADACKKAGAVMIDNSSAFRMRPDVPLVVPEINAADLKKHQGIIAVPNCSAIILGVPLWPLHQAATIERIIVSTYQSASGAGAQAMAELETQARAYAAGQPLVKEIFPHQIAFNVFSHTTAIAENGYNEEENKVIEETRKIFHEPALPIVATCIRVPVLRAHSESIVIETKKTLSPAEAREILGKAPGIKLVDNAEKNHFPMPIEASGQYDVLVGRIRRDLSHPRGLALFVSGDQLLKGAAWNAVQILECLVGPADSSKF